MISDEVTAKKTAVSRSGIFGAVRTYTTGHAPDPQPDNNRQKGRGVIRGLFHKERTMRLDKWLKVSRLIKRRTVANDACDNARVSANGRPVKASYDVKAGDVLELRFGERSVKVEVLTVAEHVGKAEAGAMYRELN